VGVTGRTASRQGIFGENARFLEWILHQDPDGAAKPARRRRASPTVMAKLNILRYPDPRLHKIARPVAEVDDRIRRLVDDMEETMRAAEGVGLAATQVDMHERVIVIDTSDARDTLHVLINPEFIARSEELVVSDEGCLSVPETYDRVQRHARVTVRAQDRAGLWRELEADGLLAVCIQHEMDHLLGKVFVEYLSVLKRTRIKARLLKQARELERER
jgi:peptide deformylase